MWTARVVIKTVIEERKSFSVFIYEIIIYKSNADIAKLLNVDNKRM